MNYAVAINSSGQATIPKAVRELLGIIPGENRLIFETRGKTVTVKREKSRAELFDETLAKIHRDLAEEERTNPAFREAKKRYAGMSYEEVMDAYYDTPEGKQEFEERYGIKL